MKIVLAGVQLPARRRRGLTMLLADVGQPVVVAQHDTQSGAKARERGKETVAQETMGDEAKALTRNGSDALSNDGRPADLHCLALSGTVTVRGPELSFCLGFALIHQIHSRQRHGTTCPRTPQHAQRASFGS